MPRWQRLMATALPEVAASVVAAPTALYGLADAGVKWAGGSGLPGAEGANKITESIVKPVREMSDVIAGEPISDNLLSGDPMQVANAWGRLALTAGISAPTGVARTISQGAAKLKTGVETVDQIGTGALKVLEALTPITITTKPSKAVAATNIAVAGAISTALEATLGPQTTVAQAKEQLDQKAAGALDVAAQGAEEVRRTDPRVVQAGLTGDPTYDAVGFGVLGAGALAYWKRNAVSRAINGIRSEAKGAVTGFDSADVRSATEMPLSVQFKQQNINRNESLPEAFKRSISERQMNTKTVNDWTDRFAEETASRTGAAVNTRIQHAYSYGELPDSAVKINPLDNWFTLRRTLADDEAQLLDRALLAQREIDTRNLNGGMQHNLFTTNTRDLQGYVQQAQANPKVALLMKEMQETNRKLADYMMEQKRFTQGEVRAFKRLNPNYVPENLTEDGARFLNPRNIGKGREGLETFEQLGSPSALWPRYIDEVIRSTEGKKIQRDFMVPIMRDKASGRPYANRLIGRTFNEKPGHGSAGDFVHWRDAYGNSKFTEVKDAFVREALRGATNPTALQLSNGLISKISRFYESGSVGTLAAATGHSFFAPASAMYTAGISSVVRDKGIAMGWIDKYVQDLTKKLPMDNKLHGMGVRGDVITTIPDMTFRAAQNVSAVVAQRVGKVLKDSIISDEGVLSYLGPHTRKLAADALDNYFKRSAVYDLQQRGILGPASLMSVDPAKRFADAKRILEGHGFFSGTGSFIGDLLHAISSAPAMSMLAMNKGKDPWKVSAAIRNMAGDPAQTGAFRKVDGAGANFAGKLTNVTPWGNIYIQANARMAQAFRKDPVGTVTGIFNAAAVPAIGFTMWNAAAGAEYVDYMLNQRTPDKVSGSFYVAIPGIAPEMGLEIPVDPLLRPFKLASEVLTAGQMGLFDGSYYNPNNSDFTQSVQDLVQHGQEMRDQRFGLGGDAWKASLEQTLMPPVVPVAKAVGAAAGVDIRSYTDARAIRPEKDVGFSEQKSDGPRSDSLLSQVAPAQAEAFVRSLGSGAAGIIFDTFMDANARIAKDGVKGVGDAAKNFLAGGKQRMADSTKMAGSGPLWDTFLAVSPSTEAAGSALREKLDGLQKLGTALSESTLPGGGERGTLLGNKRTGLVNSIAGGPAAAPGLQMQQLGQEAKRLHQELSQAHLQQLRVLQMERGRIGSSLEFSPEDKRAYMNKNAFEIIELNRRALQDVTRYETILSQQFGRPIKFDKIDLGKMLGQQAQ